MPLWALILSSLISLGATTITLHRIIPSLRQANITGRDLNKTGSPAVPEMGGLGTIAGVSTGFVLILSLNAFLGVPLRALEVLGIFSTVLTVALIGVFDDLFDISQSVKAITPVLAAAPLVSINVGVQSMRIPFAGTIELGLIYPLLLIPIGVTGAANAFNMLAGFNGMEVGVGLVAVGSLAVVAWVMGSGTALIILLIVVGALLATLYFNFYPAKVLVGDVGTLTIGAIVASAVIIGNFEVAGLILIAPHFLDFLFKAFHGFPSEGWGGEIREEDNKLRCANGALSLPQFIMKITGGVTERNLTLTIMALEAVAGIFAVAFYAAW